MDLDRDKNLGTALADNTLGTGRTDGDLGMNATTTGKTSPGPVVEDRRTGRSNLMAYLIGGLVIAGGLLAFLFYDGSNRDVNTTSSTQGPVQAPASPSAPGTTSPTTPSAPAR